MKEFVSAMREIPAREPLFVSREQVPQASLRIATCIDEGICVNDAGNSGA